MGSAFEIDMVATVSSVIDGDSFYVVGDEVRFGDVSSPEWNEYGGAEATAALINLIEGQTVYLDTDQRSGRGPYGRLIAVVYIKLNVTHYMNVNQAMVILGHATVSDYTNNEFNPYSWNLLEPTGLTLPSLPPGVTLPSSPPVYDSAWLIRDLLEEYVELNTTYTALLNDYYILQIDYNALEAEYTTLLNEPDSAIPGFTIGSIIVGFTAYLYVRRRIT